MVCYLNMLAKMDVSLTCHVSVAASVAGKSDDTVFSS